MFQKLVKPSAGLEGNDVEQPIEQHTSQENGER